MFSKEQKRIVKDLLDFLNEIKITFFTSENKFKQFIEILERHVSQDDLMELEAMLR